jgi:hypothetical protein
MSKDYVALNVQIPKSLAQAMAAYKAETGVSLTAFVRRAIKAALGVAVTDTQPATASSPAPLRYAPRVETRVRDEATPLPCSAPVLVLKSH